MKHGMNDDSFQRVLIDNHVFLNREKSTGREVRSTSLMSRSRKLLQKAECLEELFFDLVCR